MLAAVENGTIQNSCILPASTVKDLRQYLAEDELRLKQASREGYALAMKALTRALKADRDTPMAAKARMLAVKGVGLTQNGAKAAAAIATHQSAPEMRARSEAERKQNPARKQKKAKTTKSELAKHQGAVKALQSFSAMIETALGIVWPMVTVAGDTMVLWAAKPVTGRAKRPGGGEWPDSWQQLASEPVTDCWSRVTPPGLLVCAFTLVQHSASVLKRLQQAFSGWVSATCSDFDSDSDRVFSRPDLDDFGYVNSLPTVMRLFVNEHLLKVGGSSFAPQPRSDKAKMSVLNVPAADSDHKDMQLRAVAIRHCSPADIVGKCGTKIVGDFRMRGDRRPTDSIHLTFQNVHVNEGSDAHGLFGLESVDELFQHAIGVTDVDDPNFDPLPDLVIGQLWKLRFGGSDCVGRFIGIKQMLVSRIVRAGQIGAGMGGLRQRHGTIDLEIGNPADSSQVMTDCHCVFARAYVPYTKDNEAILGRRPGGGFYDDRTRQIFERPWALVIVFGKAETKDLYADLSGPVIGIVLEEMHMTTLSVHSI